jgi:hypothetical protein
MGGTVTGGRAWDEVSPGSGPRAGRTHLGGDVATDGRVAGLREAKRYATVEVAPVGGTAQAQDSPPTLGGTLVQLQILMR